MVGKAADRRKSKLNVGRGARDDDDDDDDDDETIHVPKFQFMKALKT